MKSANAPLPDRLRALAAWLPRFEDPAFRFGESPPLGKTADGRLRLTLYEMSDDALQFIKDAYAWGWVDSFNWPEWVKTEEAAVFRDDPAAIVTATPEQLSHLLTTFIRQDRFVDGALAGAYESGFLTAIVGRAAVLLAEQDTAWTQ